VIVPKDKREAIMQARGVFIALFIVEVPQLEPDSGKGM